MKKWILLLALSFFIIIIPAIQIFAQNLKNSITISPVVSNITLNKGEHYISSIYVTNNSNTPQKIDITVSAFKEQGTTNHPQFSQKINAESTSRKWILIQKYAILYPFKNTKIPYTINVPANASPGGHYLSIMVQRSSNTTHNKIIQSLGSLIILTVNGRLISTGFIKNFSATKNIYFNNPINFNLKFSNTGNVQYAPFGFITVKNIFGNTVLVTPINQKRSLTLKNSTRLYTKTIDIHNILDQIGLFNVTLNLTYGINGHFVNTQTSSTFYYFNYIYLIILLLIVVFIILYIIKRKHNKK
ncbi:hypothetical protein M1145_02345 [Patescibacteria group bacterium]|nr:hypothetical protein [Patescibacteria group bacterium]